MTTSTQQASIDFGSQIVDMAFQQELDYSTIFTGTAIAASAMLVDYVATEEGTVDDMSLQYAINQYVETLKKACEFAVAHLNKPAV
jgi:hypothetical protein